MPEIEEIDKKTLVSASDDGPDSFDGLEQETLALVSEKNDDDDEETTRSSSQVITEVGHDDGDDVDGVRQVGRKRAHISSDEDDDNEEEKQISAPKCSRRRWSQIEQDKVFGAFGQDISNKIVPNGARLVEMIKQLNTGRTVAQLRSYIHNVISGKVNLNR